MNDKELCQWLRDNSSGVYRPSAAAADRIEELTELLSIAWGELKSTGHIERSNQILGIKTVKGAIKP